MVGHFQIQIRHRQLLLVALVSAVVFIVHRPLHGQEKGTSSLAEFDKAKKALNDLAEDDSKLRTSYREIVVEAKKLGVLMVNRPNSKGGRPFLDTEMQVLKDKIENMIVKFKKDQGDLSSRIKETGLPAIEQLANNPNPESTKVLIRFIEFFVFDDKAEIAELKASSSFVDQTGWQDAVAALSKKGKDAIPELKKSLPTGSYATRIGTAKALGIIGPDVHKADPNILGQISELYGKTNTATLDRTERDRRLKILKEAMEQIRPAK